VLPVLRVSGSEPGTQMTLKVRKQCSPFAVQLFDMFHLQIFYIQTFHFAGVSSMNVTLRVPRLKEIINASKAISTPIITARLVKDDNRVAARMVKAAIEKTTLGEIAEFIKEVYAPGKCCISVKLDTRAIEQFKLEIDAFTVRTSILRGPAGMTIPAILRALKDFQVKVKQGSKSRLRIYVPDKSEKALSSSQTAYFAMQSLKVALPQVIVQGIPSVNRAVIHEEDKDGRPSYHLLIERYGLAEVMGAPGVDGKNTTTNHIIEVEQTLGVEAARTQISNEIHYIMSAYGIGIDVRHLLLLSDIMTFKGEVHGITRYGVSK
jgi:DNA-directed RNA polymerase III subunit RPC1